MRCVFKPIFGCVLAGLLAGPLFAADTVDEVCKKLEDNYAKVKSYTVKMKMTQDMDMGSMKSKSDADGQMEYKRGEGKKFYMRNEMKMNSLTSAGGQDTKTAQSIQSVADGEFMWTYVETTDGEMKGQKFCSKSKAEMDMNSITAMKDQMDLKLLPDEKVDGQDCYVIEAKNKSVAGQPEMDSKQVMYFRKDAGIPVKIVGFMNGKQFMVTTLSDLKLGASIADDRFKFKVPEGVEVQDMTKIMDHAAAPADGEKKAEEPKAEPKKEEPKKEEPKEEPKKGDDKPKKPLLPKPKLP